MPKFYLSDRKKVCESFQKIDDNEMCLMSTSCILFFNQTDVFLFNHMICGWFLLLTHVITISQTSWLLNSFSIFLVISWHTAHRRASFCHIDFIMDENWFSLTNQSRTLHIINKLTAFQFKLKSTLNWGKEIKKLWLVVVSISAYHIFSLKWLVFF